MEFPRGHERLGIPADCADPAGGGEAQAGGVNWRSRRWLDPWPRVRRTFVSSIKYIAIFKIKKGPPLPGGLLSIADFATAR